MVLCAVALCGAAPAEVREREQAPRGHSPALTAIDRPAAGRRPPLASQRPRVHFTQDRIVREDGRPGDRRAVVGSLPLAPSVAAEVGLFSVTGASAKEREPNRTDPLADIQPRRSRVAAVGLRMRF